MAITNRPQDKHALLFTGPTAPQFMADIQNVYGVLTGYYNYPPANITVVLGGPATAPFPGSTVHLNATGAGPDAALGSSPAAASAPPAGLPGLSRTALLYVTGGADAVYVDDVFVSGSK